VDPYLHSPFFLIFYIRKSLHLHSTERFYTELYSAESERVVFSDEAESCIVGSISFGTTSATIDNCAVNQTVFRWISLLRFFMSERAHNDTQSFVFV